MESEIGRNVAAVRERIAAACQRAGRRPEGVLLLAVSKTIPPERIRAAFAAGVRDFGENRVQEAAAKRAALADLDIAWHLVGHLQSNKVRAALDLFTRIDSVDSARLAQKLDAALRPGAASGAAARPGRLPVLIEVNLAGEATKSGVSEAGALQLARDVAECPALELRGLMTVPPYSESPEAARPYFSRLRALAGVIDSARVPGVRMDVLSMGMSHDFEIAIEEGATEVRVGTALFGARA